MSRTMPGPRGGFLMEPQAPYAPSPRVQEGLRREGLRLWTAEREGVARRLLELLAQRHHCAPEEIILGPSKESLIYLAALCFCEGGSGRPVLGDLPGKRRPRKQRPFRRGAQEFWQLSFDDYIRQTQRAALAPESAWRYRALLESAELQIDLAQRAPDGTLVWPRGRGLYVHACPDRDGGGLSLPSQSELAEPGVWILDLSQLALSGLEAHFWLHYAAEGGSGTSGERSSQERVPRQLFWQLYQPGPSLCLGSIHVSYMLGPAPLIQQLTAAQRQLPLAALPCSELALLYWALQDAHYYQRAYQTCREMRLAWLEHATELGYEVREGYLAEVYFRHPTKPAEELLAALKERGVGLCTLYQPQRELRLEMGSRSQLQALLYILEELLD